MSEINSIVLDPSQHTIIEVVLYKNNWKDNQIVHLIKNQCTLINQDYLGNSFFIDILTLKFILNEFADEIREIDNHDISTMPEMVNSLYFLRNIVANYKNLKFLKINVSDRRKYTRLVNGIITFSHKILHTKICIPNYLNQNESDELRQIFVDIGIVFQSKIYEQTYVSIRVNELFDKIELNKSLILSEMPEDGIINKLLNIIDPKTEIDNPIVLFVF